MWSYANRNEYRRQYDAWLGDVLLGVLFATAVGSLTEDSRNKNMAILRKERERLYAMLALVSQKGGFAGEQRKKEDERIAAQAGYATALASLGKFGSVDQLEAAITALNETIRENQSRDSNGSDTGTATNDN